LVLKRKYVHSVCNVQRYKERRYRFEASRKENIFL